MPTSLWTTDQYVGFGIFALFCLCMTGLFVGVIWSYGYDWGLWGGKFKKEKEH